MNPLPTKRCATCGRSFAWRRRWRANWEAVRYCSRSCRERRPNRLDRRLEVAILRLLAGRAAGASICPSEAARAVSPDHWRSLMERSRRAGRRLAAEGRVVFLQKESPVEPSTARGPLRLALSRSARLS